MVKANFFVFNYCSFFTFPLQAFLHADDDAEETLLQKLLGKIMICANKAYPANNPTAFPPDPAEDVEDVNNELTFFPAYPRVRLPRKYKADEPNQAGQDADLEFCRKFASTAPTLCPGKCIF